MDNVIWGTDFRAKVKPSDREWTDLERMAFEIFNLHLPVIPTYGFNDTAPSDMPPPEAS